MSAHNNSATLRDLAQRLSLVLATCFFALLWPTMAHAEKPAPMSAQTVTLPSGPAAVAGLGESFSINSSTGAGSFSIPIVLPPGISTPSVSLNYAPGVGRRIAGMNFDLPVLHVYRTTDKGSPNFNEDDRFAVSGPTMNDELVRVADGRYRLKNEDGSYALFEYDADANEWTIHLPSGALIELGSSSNSQLRVAGRVAKWYIARHIDLREPAGANQHAVDYTYEGDADEERRLARIDYQVERPLSFQNHVEFVYAGRQTPTRDYRYGDLVEQNDLLSEIHIYQGERRLRYYRLSYRTNDVVSLLSRVQMFGEQGEAMPPVTLEYTERVTPGAAGLVSMAPNVPYEGLSDGRAQLEDVNGDALPDLLYGLTSDYYYYENIDGLRWSEVPISLDGPPDRGLSDSVAVLADIDGDGKRDLVHEHAGGGFRYYPAGDIEYGYLMGYESYEDLDTVNYGISFTDDNVRILDLNGDGRVDILAEEGSGATRLLNTGTRLEQESLPALPIDADLSDPATQLVDFNGDGVLDLVRIQFDYSNFSRVRVWYGRGGGHYESEVRMTNVPFADPSDLRLADVNNDGQSDLLWVSGTWAAVYLNHGRDGFTDAVASIYGLPSASRADNVMLVDMNGNGTSDLVWVSGDDEYLHRLTYLDFMPEPFPGLLSRIDNGMGKVTEIDYHTSTFELVRAKKENSRWSTTLPFAVPVISEMRTTDSMDQLGVPATETRTAYRYYDGYYDGKEREFRGFGRVEVISVGDEHHPTSVVETRYHLGRNLDTGEDEEPLKGKPYLRIVRDDQGRIFTTEEIDWTWDYLCQEDYATDEQILPRCAQGPPAGADPFAEEKDFRVSLARKEGSVQGVWEGGLEPRFTGSRVEAFDEWGRPTATTALGEVRFPGQHTLRSHERGATLFEDIAPLDIDDVQDLRVDPVHGWEELSVTQHTTYLDDIVQWRIGLVGETRVEREDQTVLQHSRIYYDGSAFEGLAFGQFTRGWPTRTETLLIEDTGSRWIDQTRVEYNNDGKAIATLNTLGQRTEVDYESNTGIFPVEERILLEDRTVRFQATYDPGFGVVETSTDANGETSEYRYDGFGRLTEVYDPLTRGSTTPALRYSYTFGSSSFPLSITRTELLTSLETSNVHETIAYADANGHPRLVKTESELGYIASGWTLTSRRGSPYLSFDSFQSSHAGFEAAPTDTPSTETWFDVMGRAVQVRAPETDHISGITAVSRYFPFEVQSYDERSVQEAQTSGGGFTHPSITRTDGFGRVREVTRENDRPDATTPQVLRWRTDYDDLGRIQRVADPAGHERFYDYDNLGRLLTVDDPNLGLIDYRYDDLGNLRSRLGPTGHEETWIYDYANRVRQYRMQHADGRPDKVFEYFFDEPDASGPFAGATHMVGRLSYVSFPTGTEHYHYDRIGRLDAEEHELWDGVSPLSDQVRDTFRHETDLSIDGRLLHARLPGGFEAAFSYNADLFVSHADAGFGAPDRAIVDSITYDHRGLLTSSRLGNGIRACRDYDTRGQLIGLLSGPDAQVNCDQIGSANVGQQHLIYHRGYDGLVDTITDHSPATTSLPQRGATYRYDRIGQLIEAQTDTFGTLGFAYDEIQNLITRTHQGGAPIALPLGDFGYGEATLGPAGPNMLTSYPDPASPSGRTDLTYDDAGQLRQYHGYSLVYDAAGQLEYAEKLEDGERRTIQFFYDAWGERRITLTSTTDSDNTQSPPKIYRRIFPDYEERDQHRIWRTGAGADAVEVTSYDGIDLTLALLDQLQAYIDAPEDGIKPLPQEFLDLNGDGTDLDQADVDAAWEAFADEQRIGGRREVWRTTHSDQLTSITLATDSAGDIVTHTSWYPYGEEAQRYGLSTSIGFAGIQTPSDPLEELGLIQMGARFYAPELGRWITPDRFIGESPERMVGNPLESNLFSYGRNNPISLRDPSGMATEPSGTVDNPTLASTNEAALDLAASNPGQFYAGPDGFAVADESSLEKSSAVANVEDVQLKMAREVGLAIGSDLVELGKGALLGDADSNPSALSTIGHVIGGELLPGADVRDFVATAVAWWNGKASGVDIAMASVGFVPVFGGVKVLSKFGDAAGSAGKAAARAGARVAGTPVIGKPTQATVPVRSLKGRQGPQEFSGSQLRRLKTNMKESGFKAGEEIDIAVVDGKRIIIDGHHRARAAGAAGIKQVPVRIWEVSAETGTRLITEAAEAAERLGLPF